MTHDAPPPPPPPRPPVISDRLVKQIARDADADERSVWKRLGGGELRTRAQRRIDASIAKFLPGREFAA